MPKIIGELNNDYIKLDKFKGEFLWHKHDEEDELFLVVKGDIVIKLRDGEVAVSEGELIIPKGVEHKPTAENEAHVLIVEPQNALNTGDVQENMTIKKLDWI